MGTWRRNDVDAMSYFPHSRTNHTLMYFELLVFGRNIIFKHHRFNQSGHRTINILRTATLRPQSILSLDWTLSTTSCACWDFGLLWPPYSKPWPPNIPNLAPNILNLAPPPPQYSKSWPPQYSKPSYAYVVLPRHGSDYKALNIS